ncbi:MAG: hypothetical protein LW720_08375 [Pirellula sp.]|nr:hypothetical protein [Pirellula sp.]
MARKTRGSLINPNEVTIVHAVAKTARNLFLLGEDFATRTHNSHRKAWIVDILEFQSSLMAIDLLDFCVMDNHVHQVLRSRPDVVLVDPLSKIEKTSEGRRHGSVCADPTQG